MDILIPVPKLNNIQKWINYSTHGKRTFLDGEVTAGYLVRLVAYSKEGWNHWIFPQSF